MKNARFLIGKDEEKYLLIRHGNRPFRRMFWNKISYVFACVGFFFTDRQKMKGSKNNP
jgi:hypothetical protein